MSEDLNGYRVVDLSTPIDPETSKRFCEVHRRFQEDTQDYHSELRVASHLGTHVESPWHVAFPGCIGTLPVTAFMGRAVLLKLNCRPRQMITGQQLAIAAGNRVGVDDIVVLDSKFHSEPFEINPDDERPHLGAAAADWFVCGGVKAVAFGDGIAIERNQVESRMLHYIVMRHKIVLVEVLRNLDQLKDDIFFMSFQPMPIAGLDSCCVRAVAIEGLPGFRPETKEETDQ